MLSLNSNCTFKSQLMWTGGTVACAAGTATAKPAMPSINPADIAVKRFRTK
ncbi:hypothetical protein GCM10022267_91560 [Lentzea roselyniae]|uniref:Uncharacterized protein n=1 Tax=Lentzea roselyniae TaxID=531940 RepID=A0ABP7CK27_9PSEU